MRGEFCQCLRALSDALGRRIVILVSLVVFVVASFGCASAHSIQYLWAFRILQGVSMACAEMMIPQPFAGRRKGIAKALVKFARNYRYFWNTHKSAPGFEPRFAGWGYELRREGAFHPFLPAAGQPAVQPLVSILIPNKDHADVLKRCLDSLAKSSYANYEVVIIENGSTQSPRSPRAAMP